MTTPGTSVRRELDWRGRVAIGVAGLRRYPGLLAFVVVLIFFLVVQGVVVVADHSRNLVSVHRERVEETLELLKMVAFETLLKHDYALLEGVLLRWGGIDPELITLEALAPNGFVLARYRDDQKGVVTDTFEKVVQHQGEELLRLRVGVDLSRAMAGVRRLSIQLAVASVILMVLLGAVSWWVLRSLAVLPLEEEVERRREAEAGVRRMQQVQGALNAVLRLTLLPKSLEEQLQEALDILLSLSWLAIEAKGSIYLADPDGQHLRLVVHRGMDPALVKSCGVLPFGRCLCGQAAALRQVLFVSGLDARHEIRIPGMLPHGHFCVPILSGADTLGLINLYVDRDYGYDPDDEAFLLTVAATLEGVIRRKQAEEELRLLNEMLEQRVGERTAELRTSLEVLNLTKDQLVQSEKMAALGRLVAGVAHEINTPVGIGFTAASHLEERTGELQAQVRSGQLRRRDLEGYMQTAVESSRLILSNLGRASQLIRSFKLVAVDQTRDELREFDLCAYLHEVLASLRPRLKKTSHQVVIDCPGELRVTSYPGAFSQIITNLVMNSLVHGFEGREGGGAIRLAATRDEATGEMVFSHTDDGVGLSEAVKAKIFDPFFTTRPGRGGSGLGMHIVYNLVTQRLEGSILCQSVVGEGARFVIRFPATVTRGD